MIVGINKKIKYSMFMLVCIKKMIEPEFVKSYNSIRMRFNWFVVLSITESNSGVTLKRMR